MQTNTIPANETLTICRAMPIWVVMPAKTGIGATTSGALAQPMARVVAVVERIPVADFRKKTGKPEGEPLPFFIQPVEIRRERLGLLPFVPRDQFSMLGPYVTPVNACGPRLNGAVAIHYGPQSGLTGRSRRAPDVQLMPQAPLAPEPGIQSEAWRAGVLKPGDPVAATPFTVPFLMEPDAGSGIRRPKQALRELVLPSSRPWQSLQILWESFGGFHVALPPAEGTRAAALQMIPEAGIWKGATAMVVTARRFFQESPALRRERQPSLDGARTELCQAWLDAADQSFSPGFSQGFQSRRPSIHGEQIFTTTVPEQLPPPTSVTTPVPAIALFNGLLVWTGTINSYMQRSLCAPRLRDGGRAVHMLQLAPSMQTSEECEISAA